MKKLPHRLSNVREVLLEHEESAIPDQARKLFRSKEQFRELANYAAHPNMLHNSNVPVLS